jgi:heat shock protein HspQ
MAMRGGETAPLRFATGRDPTGLIWGAFDGNLHWYAKELGEHRAAVTMTKTRAAKYKIGQVVRHRLFPFRGVIFDVDPVFNNTEEWWLSIPVEIRPSKDQPFYHLFAENAETEYVAYVSEQNLLPDTSGEPIRHPQVARDLRAGWHRHLPPAALASQLMLVPAVLTTVRRRP